MKSENIIGLLEGEMNLDRSKGPIENIESWLYVMPRVIEVITSRDQEGSFWEIFHQAWGKDTDQKDGPDSEYNELAWEYVQARMLEYYER